MKINFSSALLDPNGTVLKHETGNLDLAHVASTALLGNAPQDNPDGQEKHKRYLLWQRLCKGGIVDVTAEDVAHLKLLIGMLWSTYVMGQAWYMLENGALTDEQAATVERNNAGYK